MSRDEVTLRLPREQPFFSVAHLVLGGLAVRLDLPLDQLEDLHVALGELLEQRETEREITVSVRVDGDTLHASLGPFDDSLREDLARDSGDGVGLRRVLETVVDDLEVTERDGASWVELRKEVR